MKHAHIWTALSCLIVSCLSVPAAPVRAAAAGAEPTVPHGAEALSALGMYFEPNLGQTDPTAQFIARAGGYTAFLTEDALVRSLPHGRTPAASEAIRLFPDCSRPPQAHGDGPCAERFSGGSSILAPESTDHR